MKERINDQFAEIDGNADQFHGANRLFLTLYCMDTHFDTSTTDGF